LGKFLAIPRHLNSTNNTWQVYQANKEGPRQKATMHNVVVAAKASFSLGHLSIIACFSAVFITIALIDLYDTSTALSVYWQLIQVQSES